MKSLALAVLALALSAASAGAAAGVQAEQPWSRPAVAGGTGAGYLVLVNKGAADALVSAESPAAAKVELHNADMAGGVMRMRAETRVAIPAGGRTTFAPGGRHLMFMGLNRSLKQGDHLPATLRFASGAVLKVEFLVTPTAPGPAADHHAHAH